MNRASVFASIWLLNVLSVVYSETIIPNQSPLQASPEISPVIDASIGSDSLKEHLESIAKFGTPIAPGPNAPISVALEAPVPDGIKPIPETTDPAEPNGDHDLKTDETGYFGYGGYRFSPYYSSGVSGYPYYSNYYNNWHYGNYYNPYYSSYPYGYNRRYYPGNYYYPYRRPYYGYYY